MAFTSLVITGASIPEYAGLGLVEDIGVIDQAKQIRRTVNGSLIDLSDSNFRKRTWRISANEAIAFPDFSALWPGAAVTITTISEFGGEPLTISGRVMTWETSFDEWAKRYDWSLEVEEI